MRKFLTICAILLSLSASAQWQQTGSRVRYVNGIGIPTRDTSAMTPADSSQILIRPADSSLYVRYKRAWQKVGAGGGGGISGSGTINRVPKWTSSTALGNSSIVDSSSSVAMNISPLGRIGIGTASPAARLQAGGDTSASQIRVYGGNAGTSSPELQLYGASSDNNWTLRGNHNTDFSIGQGTFGNYGTQLLTLTAVGNGGNLGISYTAPAAKLSVNGTALINTNTNNGVDRLQVSGSAIASTLKVNTSGQTLNISTFYNSGLGNNLWINNTAPATVSGEQNIGIGVDAMISNTSGYYNTGIGGRALQRNTSGFSNVALGFSALEYQTTGQRNVGIGTNALNSVVSGTDNFGIGAFALQFTTGSKNVGIGSQVLYENTTGSSNIAFGLDAGRRISGGGANQTSNQSIFIGEDTRASGAGNTNEMVFGHTAIGQGSNTVTLGNSSITKTFLRGNTMVNTTTDNGVDELQVNGSISGIGFKQAYVTKTGAYTATNDDYIIDCTSGTFTVTLPASSGRTGRILIIKNSGTGIITVDGNGSETIDGNTTYSLNLQYDVIQIVSDGTNWKIISKF
ncbi:MAG: hypothetical protein ACK5WP_03045 [Neisseriaceae bacterium]|jgi:hypothetical protein